MKKALLLLIIFAALTIIGCKKNKISSPSIIGKWELSSSFNGTTGKRTTYPSGNGNIYIFGVRSYEIYNNGALQKSGTYKIVKEMSSSKKELADVLVYYEKPQDLKTFVDISDNHLSFYLDAYDAISTSYVKVGGH